jgi:hypothetical protein
VSISSAIRHCQRIGTLKNGARTILWRNDWREGAVDELAVKIRDMLG